MAGKGNAGAARRGGRRFGRGAQIPSGVIMGDAKGISFIAYRKPLARRVVQKRASAGDEEKNIE